jgi:hypothetical protein
MHLLLALLLAVPSFAPVPPPENRDAGIVPGRFVVSDTGLHAARARGHASNQLLGHVVIDVDPEGDAHQQARRLSEELGVEVTPMVMYQLMGDPTSEPLFGEQWSLRNTGEDVGTPGADIAVGGAWRWARGAGVIVAVVDSGLDASHPEFTGRVWSNPGETASNGVDDDGNGFVDDANGWDFVAGDGVTDDEVGHGTAVSSVLAATVDGSGMTGVAPAATLMPLKACGSFGCPAEAVAQAIVYAVDNGADVINLSLGAPGVEPLVKAAVEYATDSDVVVVAAAGNEGDNLDLVGPWTPVSIDGVLGVAWTDQDDRLASRSNYGRANVDVAAPGELIVTASAGGGHQTRSGTSFSAPHVAGVVALMRSIAPSIDPATITAILGSTGRPLPELAATTSSGARVDATRAVQAARFRDIVDSVFADDIMWAATEGLTKGCTDTLFCPDEPVTRGQMAAFLTRALDLAPTGSDFFTDDDGSIFEDDINRLATAGITTGCSPTAFCGDDPVSRAQMAAFLNRAFVLADLGSDTFTDDDGSIFEDDIERLAAAGITKGCNPPTNDRFCPDATVTRGELTAFLRRSP